MVSYYTFFRIFEDFFQVFFYNWKKKFAEKIFAGVSDNLKKMKKKFRKKNFSKKFENFQKKIFKKKFFAGVLANFKN